MGELRHSSTDSCVLSRRSALRGAAQLGIGVAGTGLLGPVAARAAGRAGARPAGDVSIRVLFQTGGDIIGPSKGLPQFLKAHPGIQVTQDETPAGDALYQKLVTQFVSGSSQYDLVEFYPTWMGDFVPPGYLVNLDPYFKKYAAQINASDYIETTQASRDKWDGSWYGIPFDNDVLILYYRADLYGSPANQKAYKAKYHTDLTPPQTWDDVIQQATFFNGRLPGLSGFATVAGRIWWAVDYWNCVYASYGGSFVDAAGKIMLDKNAFIEANNVWLRLLKLSPTGILNFGYTETKEALRSGKAAICMQWASTAITDPRGLAKGITFGFAVMPGVRQSNGTILHRPVFAVGKTLAIPAASKHPDEAFQYGMWLSSPRMQALETLSGSGVDPNRYSVFARPDVKAAWDGMIPVLQASLKIGIPDLRIKNASKYYSVIGAELSAIWAGQESPASGYANVWNKWQQIAAQG
jgi:multiple sugar transport system substrate-binding protein